MTFEHTYTNQGRLTNHDSFDFDVIYTQTGIKYVTYNRTDTSATTTSTDVQIYDENHNLLKTITCPNLIKVYSITDKLFNNDDKLEILYQSSRFYMYLNQYPMYLNDVILRDEDGNILASLGERIGAKIYKTPAGNYKLIVHTYDNPQTASYNNNNPPYYHEQDFINVKHPDFPTPSQSFLNSSNYFHDVDAGTGAGYVTTPYSFDVYALSGTLSVEQEQQYLKNNMIGFPIPTQNTLNIAVNEPLETNSKIEIFNINGQKVLEKPVQAGSINVNLDVSTLSSGTYIYKLNGKSSKFIKE